MDKISKALKKFSEKELNLIKTILKKIYSNETYSLDIKKLKNRNDIFRARKGKFRIIYKKEDKNIKVLTIERHSDRTYKKI